MKHLTMEEMLTLDDEIRSAVAGALLPIVDRCKNARVCVGCFTRVSAAALCTVMANQAVTSVRFVQEPVQAIADFVYLVHAAIAKELAAQADALDAAPVNPDERVH